MKQVEVYGYRRYRDIDIKSFQQDILESDLVKNPPEDLNELMSLYNSTLQALIDKHAPLLKKFVRARPHAPWYSDDIRAAKQRRRAAGRRYRKSRLEVDRQILIEVSMVYQEMCNSAKQAFYNKKDR